METADKNAKTKNKNSISFLSSVIRDGYVIPSTLMQDIVK